MVFDDDIDGGGHESTATNANGIILVAESIHLLAAFFFAKFFAASNALNAVPVRPT